VINALLAEELATRHTVTVLTSRAGDLADESMENGVRVVRVPVYLRRRESAASMVSMLSYVLAAPGLGRRHMAAHPYDVINTHFVLPSGPVGDRLARGNGIPNVLSVHGGDLYDPSKITSPHRHPLLRAWIRRLAHRADEVVGQSTNTLENLRRYYTPEIPGVRIPLGIRRPPEGVASRDEYGLPADEILLVTVGRVVARKAVHQLLEVVAGMDEFPVRLLIVGDGPLVPSLQEECAKRGVTDRVRFMGKVSELDKFRILRMCDLFVSTSQHEGFGLVFLEAMACGLPVICYNHGGQTDFLVDGETGSLLELNDLQGFGKKCSALAANAAERKRTGSENLRRVEDYFIEHCAVKYEEVFQRVLKDHQDSRRG
jgi:glycosyltransferase involved in cell wall biosynthesis